MSREVVFTIKEINMLIVLASREDPKKYPKPVAKALLYKCQEAVNDPPNRIRII